MLGRDKIDSKQRPSWIPGTVEGVTDEMISRFFNPKSEYLANAPKLETPGDLTKKQTQPMRYGLPTEDEVGELVRGVHKSGGTMMLTLDELVGKFSDLRPGKMGVKEKVQEIASRRCSVVDNADGNFVWLKWKHGPRLKW